MTDNFARLLALMGGNGGSGGTTDYEALTNKPSIGGVTLIGDLTLAELGIVVDSELSTTSTNPVQNAVLTALLNAFPYNNVTGKPQINGVTLTGNVTLAQLGLNALWVGTQAEYALVKSTLAVGTLVVITDDNDMDSTPTQNSTNVVSSGGVYAFVVQGLDGKVDKVQGKGLSTEDYTTAEKTKLGGIEAEANKTVVDSALDGTSTNPVQNKVVKTALDGKQDTLTTAQLAAANSGVTAEKIATYDDVYAVLNYNAQNHNGIYRGKDLTNVYTVEQIYERVHAGGFEDLYLGDYFTVSITTDIMTRFTGATFEEGVTYYEVGGADPVSRTFTATEDTEPQSGKIYCTKLTKTENVDLMFAAFDYYYNIGDTALTTHHAVLIPRGAGFATTAKMNSTNTTAGGYYSSDMHQVVLPCYAMSLKTALGNHLLSYKTWLTTAVNASAPSMAGAGMTGASSASEWKATKLQLMNEVQLYGSAAWSSSAYDVGADNEKLPVFNFINPIHFERSNFWLRSVVSSARFAYCTGYGDANNTAASNAHNVRPIIIFG